MGIFRQFPYSNFHDMNMDQIIKIMRQMQDEWETTKDEWASYKDYIDNYFATLDLSQEVLDNLRVMAASGELATVINPTIISEVDQWLNEHITPTTPVIDSSLTISGAAADAKAAGDAIRKLDSEMTAGFKGYNVVKPPASIGRYYFNPSSGTLSSDNTRCVYMEGIALRGATLIDLMVGNGYQANYFFYNEEPSYQLIEQGGEWFTGNINLIIVPAGATRVMIMARKPDNSAISDGELMNMFNVRLREADPDVIKYTEDADLVYPYGGHYQYAGVAPTVNQPARLTQDVFYEIDDYDVIHIKPLTGYRLAVNLFDSNFERLGNTGAWITGDVYYLIKLQYPTARYFKITVTKIDNTNITLPEIINLTALRFSITNIGGNFNKKDLNYKAYYDHSSSDVAVYDDTIVIADTDKLWINGTEITARVGHGNNIMFGQIMDGDLPRLYAGGWYTWEHHVFVNKLTANSATLIDTIELPGLPAGYVNAAVDDLNELIYVFLERGEDTFTGDVLFAVCDFTGAVITTKELPVKLPLIQGMDFKNGLIYVSSGLGTDVHPNIIYVFNTSGDIIGVNHVSNGSEIEGICVDNHFNIYIKLLSTLYDVK